MDKSQRIYDELYKKLSNPNLTKEERLRLINAAGQEYNKEVDREYNRYVTQQRIGAALEIGSAAIPVGGVINGAAKISAPLVKKAITSKPVRGAVGKVINSAIQGFEKGIPVPEVSKSITGEFGRKIPQDIVKSGIHGAIDGFVFGVGRGLMEDKNTILTSIHDGVLGLGLGAGIGGAVSKLEQRVLGNKLGQYEGNFFDYTRDLKKEFSNDAKTYYRNYVQDRTLDKNGRVDFTGRGLQEMLTWNPNEARNFPTLVEDIKNAKRLSDAPNIKQEQKPNVRHYEVYQGNNGLHKIEVLKDGNHRYYFTKGDAPIGTLPTNLWRPNKGINYSINDYLSKNNPAEWLNPRLTTGAEKVLHNPHETLNATSNFINSQLSMPVQQKNLSFDKSEDESSGVYKLGISYNDIQNFQDKIFTPAEIGNMSTEEFTKNEAKIFEQVKNGQIQLNKTDYSKFSNPYSNNRIYTVEEFVEMSPDEMAKNKEAINHQISQIGLPTNQDMENSAKSGGIVYVEGYTRNDGTKVKGYYRRK